MRFALAALLCSAMLTALAGAAESAESANTSIIAHSSSVSTATGETVVDRAIERRFQRMRRRGVFTGAITLDRWQAERTAWMQQLVAPTPVRDANASHSRNAMGVYLTPSSASRESFVQDIVETLKANGGNALVIDVKGSRVFFDSQSEIAEKYQLEVPLLDLPVLVAKLKEMGVYTIARVVSLKDHGLAESDSTSHIRHPVTGRSIGSVWVDGGTQVVLDYNRQVLKDVIQSGIEEINLDYIRYPTEYPQSLIGLTGEQKADRVEAFIRMLREEIDAAGLGTKLGLSTYAILGWNFPVNLEPLGQHVVRFAPLVDIISPMAYPQTFAEGAYFIPGVHPISRDYYLVHRTLTGYQELIGPEHAHKIRPWIQGYYVTPQMVRDQMKAVRDAGVCGFTVWNARNVYDPVFAVMDEWQAPEHCTTEKL